MGELLGFLTLVLFGAAAVQLLRALARSLGLSSTGLAAVVALVVAALRG